MGWFDLICLIYSRKWGWMSRLHDLCGLSIKGYQKLLVWFLPICHFTTIIPLLLFSILVFSEDSLRYLSNMWDVMSAMWWTWCDTMKKWGSRLEPHIYPTQLYPDFRKQVDHLQHTKIKLDRTIVHTVQLVIITCLIVKGTKRDANRLCKVFFCDFFFSRSLLISTSAFPSSFLQHLTTTPSFWLSIIIVESTRQNGRSRKVAWRAHRIPLHS